MSAVVYPITTGVSRLSPAQIEALHFWAQKLPGYGGKLAVRVDLVEVPVDPPPHAADPQGLGDFAATLEYPVQLLRARCGNEAVVINVRGRVVDQFVEDDHEEGVEPGEEEDADVA